MPDSDFTVSEVKGLVGKLKATNITHMKANVCVFADMTIKCWCIRKKDHRVRAGGATIV